MGCSDGAQYHGDDLKLRKARVEIPGRKQLVGATVAIVDGTASLWDPRGKLLERGQVLDVRKGRRVVEIDVGEADAILTWICHTRGG